jgi:outer membrane protein assembly factor BamB
MEIESDDPINPVVPIDLIGWGIYPDQHVQVNTTSINFGSVWVAGDGMTGRDFEIYNHGAAPLNLISLTFNNPAFFDYDFEPGALASMDTLVIPIYFMPEQTGFHSGTMTLTTDDPATPILNVALAGTGTATAFGLGDIIWRYQITVPATFDGFNSLKFMDDANGDGIPEMLGANEDYNVYCFNGQSAGTADVFYTFDTGWDPMHTGDVEYERGMVSAPDLNSDGTGDFVIGTTGGSESIFAVSGADGEQLWQFDTNNYGDGGWVYEVTCEDDWNLDHTDDVLAAVGGPQGASDPKSVFLLNGETGSLIWRAHLQQTVYSVRKLGHLNWDLYPEVVCGTSPYTGTYYVKVLNGWDGQVIWTTEVDNVVFSLNSIEDVNGDGVNDVAVAAAFGGVYGLSGIDGSIIWHTPGTGTNYYLEVTEDLNGNGYDDILVTSVNGTFYAYEGTTGATIWSVPLGSNVLSLAGIPDITGDNIADAIAGTMYAQFYAIDGTDGSVLFNYSHGAGSSYAFDCVGWLPDIDNNGGVELLGGTRDGHVYCFSGGAVSTPSFTLHLEPVTPPPIQIPPGGGSFDFSIALSNLQTTSTNVDVWIMSTIPGGSQVGPLLGPVNITMAPLSTIERERTQFVPDYAPPGSYTYDGYVGIYPDQIWEEEHFPFQKMAEGDGSGTIVSEWFNDGEPFENTAVEVAIPAETRLLGCYPNPFNPTAVISYQLSVVSQVSLEIYDVSGRLIESPLHNVWRDAGVHEVTFDGSNLASGIYFYRIEAGDYNAVRKMILVK